MSPARAPWWYWPLLLAATAAGLAGVMVVHATGQTLLAVVLLVLVVLALWVYTSPRTQALRYVFPGVAGALVFVVFPMLYTVGMGFTNQSSQNLLSQERAHALLMAERVAGANTQRPFSLHGPAPGPWRLYLAPVGETPGWVSEPFNANARAAAPVAAVAMNPAAAAPEQAELPMAARVMALPTLRALAWRTGDGAEYTLLSLRELAQQTPLFETRPHGALADRLTGTEYRPNPDTGFFTSAQGERLAPGYLVGVGWRHYASVFTDAKYRQPFLSVFAWTVAFAALSVLGAAALGLLLASLMQWEALKGKGFYRLVLFLPYAVPGFLSILVFKGLFNQNLGEVNLVLNALFGIKPAWFSDPWAARAMLLFVNIWLGFPYMMVLCSGLIQSIPGDLQEASAILGAGPFTHFRRVTLPLIVKPLTPLLISAFAFNFNNFVLISLLTNGRPDQLDATLPAGTTDILVSYTWRIAFQDSGQQFGLAAAISTVIFLLVASVTLLQMRFARVAEEEGSRK
jgi:maltose/maltodextrin transport system permease protein